MPVRPAFLESDKTTPFVSESYEIDAGDNGDPLVLWIANDLAAAFADTDILAGLRVRLEWKSGLTEWKGDGHPVVEQLMGTLAVTDIDNSGDETMAAQTTGEIPIGTGNEPALKDIPKGCARQVTFRWRIPAAAATAGISTRLVLVHAEGSIPLAYLTSAWGGGGVLLGHLDASERAIVRGGILTASGATVTLSDRSYAVDGRMRNNLQQTFTANQNDSAAAALTAGQHYWAIVTQPIDGSVAVLTKGVKGIAPAKPAIPTDHFLVGDVKVDYQAGGTSDIQPEDIDQSRAPRGEFEVLAGEGLQVVINGGRAMSTTDRSPYSGVRYTLSVVDDDTSYIWLEPDGASSATLTEDPPVIGAELLAEAEAVAGVVTVTDRRTFIGRAVTELPIRLTYKGEVIGAVAVADWAIVPAGYYIHAIDLDVGSQGTGGTGSTKVDVWTRAVGNAVTAGTTTVFTSHATRDLRPAVAAGASSLRARALYPEVIDLEESTRIGFDIVEAPSGQSAPPADLVVTVWLRRR